MSASQATDLEIRTLVQQAERAHAAGRREESQALLSRARSANPEHPLVLNALAVQDLHNGKAALARTQLEQAVASESKNPALWVNLATALRMLGLPDEEMAALERALVIEPRHLVALLQKASLLDIQGKRKEAATAYGNALVTIPAGTQLPEALRSAIQRAVAAVRENNAALETFLSARLEPVRARHAGADASRFEHCVDSLLAKRRIYTPQPTFLHFPKLPAEEFYSRSLFPWLEEIDAATSTIRAEFERVVAEDADQIQPYVAYREGLPLDQWKELNHSRRWSVYYLWRDGRPIAEHLARCPQTAALMERVAAKVDIAGVAPAVFFSILDAKSHIPAHTGVTNTRLIVHLPLVVPPGCRFRVGSDVREWQPGKAWVFDDTIEHEAWNDSDVPRGVLIFDIWNPYLSEAERDLVRATVEGVTQYYGGHSPLAESH